eukprot:206900_1
MTRDSHAIIQPLKGTSYMFLNHPTQSFTSKQLCDYIEMIVLHHIKKHETHHHTNTNLQPIRETLSKLRSLLIIEPEMIALNAIDDEKLSINVGNYHPLSIIGEKSHPNINPKSPIVDQINNSKNNETNGEKRGEKSEKLISTKTKHIKWCTHSTRNLWDTFIPSSALLHHPLYSIPVDKYCGILRGSVRQDWNTVETEYDEERNWEELKPHWFELFFDLMFVAAIVHISSEVADAFEHYDYIFIVTVFPQFGLLILCWLEQALYHSRFRMTQISDGFLRFVYMGFVLLMGLSIGNTNYQTSQKLFLIAYMFTKLIMCIMFIKSSFIPRAINHSIYMIIENVLNIISVIFVEIFINSQKQWIWVVIYSVLFLYSWFHMAVFLYLHCIRDLGINIPINVPHIAERMGAFVLIILGETIISIMVQHVESTRNGIITAYTVTFSFFVIVYCIGKLYFGSQPSEYELHHHTKSHAMSTSVWRARIYKWFHILLFFGLLGLGLGSKITVHELPHYHKHPFFVFMPGISCVVICICVNIIRLTHPFDYSDKHPHLVIGVWLVRILCIVIMICILFTWKIMNHFIILAVYVICFIMQIAVDFEAKHRLIVTKSHDKTKSLHFYKSPKGIVYLNRHKGGKHHKDDESGIEYTVTTREMSFIGTF